MFRILGEILVKTNVGLEDLPEKGKETEKKVSLLM